MDNPLARSIDAAIIANRELDAVMAFLGTKEYPRGRVLSSYRSAIHALRNIIRSKGYPMYRMMSLARDVMDGLQRDVRAVVEEAILKGTEVGKELARKQLSFYGLSSADIPDDRIAKSAQLMAVLAEVNVQTTALLALLASQEDESLIFGDDNRTGILRPSSVIQRAASAALMAASSAFLKAVGTREVEAGGFKKQAVAALDERTTDCCLRVHGQIRELGEPFHLTGTPRYADDLDRPPFHWYCRTCLVLYKDSFDDGLTESMRSGAQRIMNERSAGGTGGRNPASAIA